MSDTAFCPAPHCQRQRPYTVGADGMRRCGYCRKELGMEDVARGAQAEMGTGEAIEALRLDMLVHKNRLDANADSVQGIREWVLKVQERVADLERQMTDVCRQATELEALEQGDAVRLAALETRDNGLSAAVNALLTRVTALEAAVAAEIAPLPSKPVPPPGGKSKSHAKKKR